MPSQASMLLLAGNPAALAARLAWDATGLRGLLHVVAAPFTQPSSQTSQAASAAGSTYSCVRRTSGVAVDPHIYEESVGGIVPGTTLEVKARRYCAMPPPRARDATPPPLQRSCALADSIHARGSCIYEQALCRGDGWAATPCSAGVAA